MIVFFSGTGNTRLCSEELSVLTGDSLHELSPQELCEPEYALLDTDNERVVWAFPTYSWGIPPVIVEVIKRMRFTSRASRAKHYMLTTCGDDMGRTDKQWYKLMRRRGVEGVGAYAVVMPNTYTLMKGFDVDSVELAAKKLTAMPARVRHIAEAILNGGEDMLVRGAFSRIKSGIIYPWFVRFSMSPAPFGSTDGCTGCGHCAAVCPMANIKPDNTGRPQWGNHCALCLRCYHSCPRHSLCYGKATLSKGQYIAKKAR